jgi:hypothetical protein
MSQKGGIYGLRFALTVNLALHLPEFLSDTRFPLLVRQHALDEINRIQTRQRFNEVVNAPAAPGSIPQDR